GLYLSFDAGNNWQKWTEGYPTVSTKDLVIHPREHDLIIGTFGRAAWVLDDIRPLRAIATDRSLLQRDIALFESPVAYQASYQQPTGSRFGGDALYNAENRKPGAMITYYLKEGKKKAENKKEEDDINDTKRSEQPNNNEKELNGVQKKDSVQFEFYDGERLIRTLKYKTPEKAGFHRIYWSMDEKGPDSPSRTINKSKDERGGVDVKPGSYKVKVSFGESTDETVVTVQSDPRLKVSSEAINEVYSTVKKLEDMTQLVADAVKQLVESKQLANKFSKELKELDEDGFEEQIKASKEIVKEIDTVIALYLGKEDKRQGITRNPELYVLRRISNASSYVKSRKSGLTTTELKLIQYAEEDLKKAVEKTNTFFNENWKPYQASIEVLNASPFKTIQIFSLE
ncbi:MAG: hypothetical protein KJN76_14265, partial [Eudoraea sp.]|nr:hypothetical protein [Eudoraea sp.]